MKHITNSNKFHAIVILISLINPITSSSTSMKVHPVPRKRNVSLHETSTLFTNRQKKLRRLPHIFNKLLVLPFNSDADILVDETPESFRFVVNTTDVGEDVCTHTIEIHPGVTKVVLRGQNVVEFEMQEFELDLWRFRLPAETRPEMASAVYVDGELIVTVPKGGEEDDDDDDDEEEDGGWGDGNGNGDLGGGGVGRLVLVQ